MFAKTKLHAYVTCTSICTDIFNVYYGQCCVLCQADPLEMDMYGVEALRMIFQ